MLQAKADFTHPLQELGLSRELVARLEAEQVIEVARLLYKRFMIELSPENRLKHPKNPINTGEKDDSNEWASISYRLDRKRERLIRAFEQVSNPEVLERLIESYQPQSSDERLHEAMNLEEQVRREGRQEFSRLCNLLTEFANPSKINPWSCGPCELKIRDIVSELNLTTGFSEGPLHDLARELSKRSIYVDSNNLIVSDPESDYKLHKKPFMVVKIPKDVSVADFLTELGFRVLPSTNLLTSEHQDPATASRRPFLQDGIPLLENQSSSRWLLSMQRHGTFSIEPKKGFKLLLVSKYTDLRYNSMPALQLEGLITGVTFDAQQGSQNISQKLTSSKNITGSAAKVSEKQGKAAASTKLTQSNSGSDKSGNKRQRKSK